MQSIEGISASEFFSSPLNSLTLQQTVANSIDVATESEVLIQSVTDLSDLQRRRHRRLSSVAPIGISVNLTVAFVTGQYGQNALLAYTAVSSELISSVASGSFSALLSANAVYNGASYLQSVFIVSVSVLDKATPSPTTSPTTPPSRAPTNLPPPKPFIAGGIAGIVIAGVLILPLIMYCIVYFTFRKNLIVGGLPEDFSTIDLKKLFPGATSVVKLKSGAALVRFDSHGHAEITEINGKAQRLKFLGQTISEIHWAKPAIIDYLSHYCCGTELLPAGEDEAPFVDPSDMSHEEGPRHGIAAAILRDEYVHHHHLDDHEHALAPVHDESEGTSTLAIDEVYRGLKTTSEDKFGPESSPMPTEGVKQAETSGIEMTSSSST